MNLLVSILDNKWPHYHTDYQGHRIKNHVKTPP